MVGNEKTTIAAFLRAASMLDALLERSSQPAADVPEPVAKARRGPISSVARELGIPISTAHRQVMTLVTAGFLQPVGGGRYAAGSRLRRLAALSDVHQVIASAAFGPLDSLAARTRSIAQLGSLDDMMVTYRIKTGHGASRFFTRVGMQLEAYCSGIGKVLLAHLPAAEQVAYLADGPFPPLTENTITDPVKLAIELETIRDCGYAIDNEEIAIGLRCFAVPIASPNEGVVAAISLSTTRTNRFVQAQEDMALVSLVRETARQIEAAAFGESGG